MNQNYPLEDLLKIKIKRFDQAIKAFEEKTEILIKENEKLFEMETERDEVVSHKMDKLRQLRAALDAGTRTDKIQQMKIYIEVVDERIAAKQKKVDAQQIIVNKAEKELEDAKKNLFDKRKELEKIKIHKDEWKIEEREIEKQIEAEEQDEIGAIRDVLRKYEKRKKQK